MKIPKYWARGVFTARNADGKPAVFSCWHWSDESIDDARRLAEARAQSIATAFLGGQTLNRYAYSARPLREEVLEIVRSGSAELACITRNGYGALVLNAARAMFIDIDFEAGSLGGSLAGALGGLFGKRPAPETRVLPSIEQWTRTHPGLGLRVYRTAAGLRCLVTSETFDPTDSGSLEMMRSLGGDPLYVTLCKQQESFRARLTPKPWRCGVPQAPSRYPWTSAAQEAGYRQWEARYGRASETYSVCRWLANYGDTRVHPDVEPIVALHDRLCGVSRSLTLA